MRSLSEVEDAIKTALFDRWLARIGWSRETWAGFAQGIPREWAEGIAATLPEIPVTMWPRILEAPKLHERSVSTRRSKSVSVNNVHTQNHRMKISEAKAGDDDPFAKAYRKRGLTQNGLAAAVGIKGSLLSMYRTGARPIPIERARAIAAIIQWPADKAHWPNLLGE